MNLSPKVKDVIKLVLGIVLGAATMLGIDLTEEKQAVTVGDYVKVVLKDGSVVLGHLKSKEEEKTVEKVEVTSTQK